MHYLIRNPLKRRLVFCLDKVGGCFPFKEDGNSPQTINSVLLIRLDHLGDVLLTTPAIKSLKRQFPDARITMVVKEWSFDAVKNNPHIDEIIVFNPSWAVSSQENGNTVGIAGMYQLVHRLRISSYDIAIDFKGDFRSILLAYLSGAKRRISYAIRGGGFLLTDIVPYEPNIHEIEKNMKLLVPLGVDSNDAREMELFYTGEDIARVEQILNHKGIDLSRRSIALHYGGASQFKCWDMEKFVGLVGRLTENNSINVLIFAGPYERKTCQFEEKPGNKIFIMPDMTICQMAAAFKRCDLLVCNDSGPMHVGFAVNTPTVAIFG
ncbi:MAG: glycosyltransferase family 9 protein, partial [Candidatus Hodarchaeota archaeon]